MSFVVSVRNSSQHTGVMFYTLDFTTNYRNNQYRYSDTFANSLHLVTDSEMPDISFYLNNNKGVSAVSLGGNSYNRMANRICQKIDTYVAVDIMKTDGTSQHCVIFKSSINYEFACLTSSTVNTTAMFNRCINVSPAYFNVNTSGGESDFHSSSSFVIETKIT